ncbi:hypothetical protein [Rugosimonospora africana]|uniref:Uncharacterized protein n=1 Tax=Rugosimonospora africana TaxID=556532 RepID=A0A8J3QTE7_9ACTN|nr:hypothetical protein [Rugosimonospora africana]GIH16154.1 hypothetical protein Raf01_43260 [Rugosimonospora africana]
MIFVLVPVSHHASFVEAVSVADPLRSKRMESPVHDVIDSWFREQGETRQRDLLENYDKPVQPVYIQSLAEAKITVLPSPRDGSVHQVYLPPAVQGYLAQERINRGMPKSSIVAFRQPLDDDTIQQFLARANGWLAYREWPATDYGYEAILFPATLVRYNDQKEPGRRGDVTYFTTLDEVNGVDEELLARARREREPARNFSPDHDWIPGDPFV